MALIPTDSPAATAAPGEGAAAPWAWGTLQSASILLLAVLASLFALHWAGALVVPVLLGLTFSYALAPLVKRLVRWRLPRMLASALLLVLMVGGIGSLAWAIRDDALAMAQGLPEMAQQIRREVARQQIMGAGAGAAIAEVQKAATELEKAAADAARRTAPSAERVTRVQVEPARFNVHDYLWTGTRGLATGMAHASVVLFVTFFMLASGDSFRRKLVRISGPSFAPRRVALSALDEIDQQIQRYLLVQLFTSALVGLAVWLSFWGLGVNNAPAWGALAFVLNFIPYLGSVILTGTSSLLAFVQFGSLEMGLLVGAVALLINSIESHVLTPWMTVRNSRLNPVAVFVGVLAWGWLWGLGGLFLGMPILIAIKAVCDRVGPLRGVGELLGH